jgi:hypothetical protein
MSIAKRLIALAALSTAAFAANATVITYTDITPTTSVSLSATTATGTVKSYTFTHDITDNGFQFDKQTLLSADLTVYLFDNINKGNETFRFNIGAGTFAEVYNDSNVANGASESTYPFTLQASLGDLSADGKLSITLTATDGDFIFTHSKLVAKADDSVKVPEPASLALLGLGLGALALRRRRKA